jgi:hypothetical protein
MVSFDAVEKCYETIAGGTGLALGKLVVLQEC